MQLLFFFTKWVPAAILDSENRLESHFSPFQNNTQILFFFKFFFSNWLLVAILDDQIHFRHFRSIHNFFFKWPPAAILEVRIAPKTIGFFHYVLSMGYAIYEVDRWIYHTVRDATSFLSIFIHFCFSDNVFCNLGPQWLWRIWIWLVYLWQSVMVCTSVGVRRQNQEHNTPEMFKFREYNYLDKLKIYLTKIQFILENHTMKIYLDTQEPHHIWCSRVKFILEYDNLPWYLRTIFSEC